MGARMKISILYERLSPKQILESENFELGAKFGQNYQNLSFFSKKYISETISARIKIVIVYESSLLKKM